MPKIIYENLALSKPWMAERRNHLRTVSASSLINVLLAKWPLVLLKVIPECSQSPASSQILVSFLTGRIHHPVC